MTKSQRYNQPRPNANSRETEHPGRKVTYLDIIEALITNISQESNRKKVLTSTLAYALALTKVEVGALLVIGDQMDEMTSVARQGMPDDLIKQLTSGDLGYLLLTGQRLWVRPQSSSNNVDRALVSRHGLKYLFGLPLRFGEQTLGAIVVSSRTSDDTALSQNRQSRLMVLTQLIALFLYNTRLRKYRPKASSDDHQHQETKSDAVSTDELAETKISDLEQLLAAVMSAEEEVVSQNYDLGFLNTLSSEVGSTLQLPDILNAAIKQTMTALNAEAGWCYLFEEGMLSLAGYHAVSEKYAAGMKYLKPHDGVEGMAFTRSEPITRDGVLFHSGKARTLVQEEGLRTVAAVPLKCDDKNIGVLTVANRYDRQWASRDRRMLLSIGQRVAQAITNSRRFLEANEKAQIYEADHQALQEANVRLTQRTQTLEYQVVQLRQAERRLWTVLAAAREAKLRSSGNSSDGLADDRLIAALKRVLTTMRQDDEELFLSHVA